MNLLYLLQKNCRKMLILWMKLLLMWKYRKRAGRKSRRLRMSSEILCAVYARLVTQFLSYKGRCCGA
ncbi:unnamed protein product [Strongylus vulgaris]|uniref:Uncharacterized protein n=1 Tax=Strongylus vulgaris TaxID=40348 RepID=A0A3P7JJS4_STRVU|nr:unnamed protein product [Strongylus vulgaris]